MYTRSAAIKKTWGELTSSANEQLVDNGKGVEKYTTYDSAPARWGLGFAFGPVCDSILNAFQELTKKN